MNTKFPPYSTPVTLGKVELNGRPLNIVCTHFPNGRAALYLTSGLVMYCRWAVNVPDLALAPDEFFAKTYDENEPLREPMLATGLFEDTGRRAVGGFVDLELWKLTAQGLAQLTAQGFELPTPSVDS